MIQIEYLALVLTGLSITVSILYYTLTLRNQNRTRETQWVTQLLDKKIDQESMERFLELMDAEWDDFATFIRKYDNTVNPKHAATRNAQWNFFEMLGGFVKGNRLDVELVYKFYNMRCLLMWFKFETVIKEYRKGTLDRDYLENFEYLAEKMAEMRLKRGLNLPLGILHPTSTLQQEYSNP